MTRGYMKKSKFIFFICFSVFLVGCSSSSKINISIDAILDKKEIPNGIPERGSFWITTDTEDQPELLVKEVQSKIEKALENKGYQVNEPSAEFLLVFRFSNPTSSRKVNIITPSSSYISTYGNTATVTNSAAYATSYDVVTYYPNLAMFVYDIDAYNKKKEEKLLWHGVACGACKSGDFRYTSNFVLYPLMKYFGKNTGHTVNMSYSMKSSEIKAFAEKISLLKDDPESTNKDVVKE